MVRATFAWLFPLTLLTIAIVCVPLMVLEEQGLPRYRALRQELRDVRERNGVLRDEVRALRRQVSALGHERQAVERIARDELGMIRESEIIFQFAE